MALHRTDKAMPIRLTLATLALPARRMATRLHRASSRAQEVTYLLSSSLILALEATAPLSTMVLAEAHPQPTLSRRIPSINIRIPTIIDSNLSLLPDTPTRTLILRRKAPTPRSTPNREDLRWRRLLPVRGRQLRASIAASAR